MIFPTRIRHDVLLRALVAVGVLIATVVALTMSAAHASPARIECNMQGCHSTVATRHHYSASNTGRPAVCRGIPWCGCWARLQVGLGKQYNLALNWLHLRHVPKQVGAWAVMRRRGGGHVGRVVAIDGNGNPVLLSGNHNGRVGRGTYPAGRILAYVEP